ncbi:hypothetical protein [Candidatus Nanohalovita haloferacivicina]|uniref:hypothetical protein n=1 Tax=Candidatus Nanohalovita haloferacivicina TaxID=2978046 RepID=UPI00325FD4F7|nr:hypothetical protein HBNXNv_1159 [Candidatus Nanohalobia archaeon BNXNv]
MKVGLDFDRVLFRTDEFKEEVLFAEIENFQETYSKIDGVYSPEKHAEKLGISIEKIMECLDRASEYLYEDIELLRDSNHEFIIVSRGDPVFQEEKVQRSGALDFVEDHIILQDRTKDVEGIEFLVDDLKKEIQNANIEGFHFKRPENSLKDVLNRLEEKEK